MYFVETNGYNNLLEKFHITFSTLKDNQWTEDLELSPQALTESSHITLAD